MVSHRQYYVINTSTAETQARRDHRCLKGSGERTFQGWGDLRNNEELLAHIILLMFLQEKQTSAVEPWTSSSGPILWKKKLFLVQSEY